MRLASGGTANTRTIRRTVAERLSNRRALLWAFVALHAGYLGVLLPLILTGRTEGDLPLYRQWAELALRQDVWHGLDVDWVYPTLAIVPIVIAELFGPFFYQLVWFLMLTALNGVALLVLTDRGRRTEAFPAAWFWLATVFLMSPVALLRLEGVTGPLVILALAVLTTRPWWSGVVLAIAAWVKVWPAAVIGAALLAFSRRRAILVSGLVVTLAVAFLVTTAGGGGRVLFGFLLAQDDRGLQIEAPIATPWLWMAVLGVPGAVIFQNLELATREVIGPGDELAIRASTPLLVIAVAVIAIIVFIVHRRLVRAAEAGRGGMPRGGGFGAGTAGGGMTGGTAGPLATAELRLVVLAAFAFAAALIVFNKVGSPQYLLWLAPIVVAGLAVDRARWHRLSWVMAATELLTTIVFPVLYLRLIEGDVASAVVLGMRNALLLVMLGWAVIGLVRAAVRPASLLDGATVPIGARVAPPARTSAAPGSVIPGSAAPGSVARGSAARGSALREPVAPGATASGMTAPVATVPSGSAPTPASGVTPLPALRPVTASIAIIAETPRET